MKILFISMHSIHVTRWIENLKDTTFELYWYDILDQGKLDTLPKVTQFTQWKKRKLPYIKGEYFLSKNTPRLFQFIRPVLEVTENEALETILKKVKPDIVHSFEMFGCAYPVLKIMRKYPNIKWLYSCWGNDLFYYKKIKNLNNNIKKVLQRVDYLHTDCIRDYNIAKELGFMGEFAGVIPGGAGYKIQLLQRLNYPLDERKIILVKGYEHRFGRALNIVKALESIKYQLFGYNVIIFGSHQIVTDYIERNGLNFRTYDRHALSHIALLEIMGKSLIYIGNNISDGMPNTLLESIIMGAFPIQSNPGNVTAEIIENYVNGLMIESPDDIKEIAKLIQIALEDRKMLIASQKINETLSKLRLDYQVNQDKIITLYNRM